VTESPSVSHPAPLPDDLDLHVVSALVHSLVQSRLLQLDHLTGREVLLDAEPLELSDGQLVRALAEVLPCLSLSADPQVGVLAEALRDELPGLAHDARVDLEMVLPGPDVESVVLERLAARAELENEGSLDATEGLPERADDEGSSDEGLDDEDSDDGDADVEGHDDADAAGAQQDEAETHGEGGDTVDLELVSPPLQLRIDPAGRPSPIVLHSLAAIGAVLVRRGLVEPAEYDPGRLLPAPVAVEFPTDQLLVALRFHLVAILPYEAPELRQLADALRATLEHVAEVTGIQISGDERPYIRRAEVERIVLDAHGGQLPGESATTSVRLPAAPGFLARILDPLRPGTDHTGAPLPSDLALVSSLTHHLSDAGLIDLSHLEARELLPEPVVFEADAVQALNLCLQYAFGLGLYADPAVSRLGHSLIVEVGRGLGVAALRGSELTDEPETMAAIERELLALIEGPALPALPVGMGPWGEVVGLDAETVDEPTPDCLPYDGPFDPPHDDPYEGADDEADDDADDEYGEPEPLRETLTLVLHRSDGMPIDLATAQRAAYLSGATLTLYGGRVPLDGWVSDGRAILVEQVTRPEVLSSQPTGTLLLSGRVEVEGAQVILSGYSFAHPTAEFTRELAELELAVVGDVVATLAQVREHAEGAGMPAPELVTDEFGRELVELHIERHDRQALSAPTLTEIVDVAITDLACLGMLRVVGERVEGVATVVTLSVEPTPVSTMTVADVAVGLVVWAGSRPFTGDGMVRAALRAPA
jgi:hypothetical protein